MYLILQLMNREQVQDEKLSIQKALLHFESIHGRPVSTAIMEKELLNKNKNRYFSKVQ